MEIELWNVTLWFWLSPNILTSTWSPHKARQPERWVYEHKGEGDWGPCVPGYSICQATCRPCSETGCTSACRGMGRSEGRHPAATHVKHSCASVVVYHTWRNYIQYLLIKRVSFSRCVQNKKFVLDLLGKLGGIWEIPDISEDCLYLNIYTPANRAHNAKLPVRTLCCRFGVVLLSYSDSALVWIVFSFGLIAFEESIMAILIIMPIFRTRLHCRALSKRYKVVYNGKTEK